MDDNSTDGMLLIGDNQSCVYNRIIDNSTNLKPHRDAVQLIPIKNWSRYAGHKQSNVYVHSNLVVAQKSNLQGICSFDGLIDNLWISFNQFKIRSPHKIAINGMLSGGIMQNKNVGRNPEILPIILRPLRLGGGYRLDLALPHVWVLSFSERELNYNPLTIVGKYQSVDDQRDKPQPSGINLIKFDYSVFTWKINNQLQGVTDEKQYLNSVRKIALECGSPV